MRRLADAIFSRAAVSKPCVDQLRGLALDRLSTNLPMPGGGGGADGLRRGIGDIVVGRLRRRAAAATLPVFGVMV